MFIEHPYMTCSHHLSGVFSPAECQRIIQSEGTRQTSSINSNNPDKQINPSYRNSISNHVSNVPSNRWLFDRLAVIFQQINQRYYHFNIQAYHGLQVLTYEVDGFYDWHIDLGGGKTSNRKLSMIGFLSSPDDYEGGELDFMSEPGYISQTQGKVLVFPPFLPHRVLPVQKGTRYSFVYWAYGPHFV